MFRFPYNSTLLSPTRSRFLLVFLFAILPGIIWATFPKSVHAASVSYYVDCSSGNDSNSGTSSSQPWRSLNKASNASLAPGDRLLLKRGCTWVGPLRASWNGTASQPIVIAAYGTGAPPLIKVTSDPGTGIVISGSYQVIEYLDVQGYPSRVDSNCKNQKVGWLAGFEFRAPAAYNTLRRSKASTLTAGINFQDDTHNNRILNNVLVNNHVMDVLTPTGTNAHDDIGAWGIILKGSNQEVAYNYFSGNNSWCSYDEGYQGNSVEVFGARNSAIHHNHSFNDKVFSELGGGHIKADGNIFAYNLYSSSQANARFLITRGAGNAYGPTWRTKVYNNTVYLSHALSQGIVCHAGCSADILALTNNILWAEEKAAYADAPFSEQHNLYWRADGRPVVQFEGSSLSGSSRIADPRFADRAAQNFRPASGSPAIDSGTATVPGRTFSYDLADRSVGSGNGVDRGAYEH